ncbi:MAG: hypothetical protein RSA10_02385 [Bacilli bacterium]
MSANDFIKSLHLIKLESLILYYQEEKVLIKEYETEQDLFNDLKFVFIDNKRMSMYKKVYMFELCRKLTNNLSNKNDAELKEELSEIINLSTLLQSVSFKDQDEIYAKTMHVKAILMNEAKHNE